MSVVRNFLRPVMLAVAFVLFGLGGAWAGNSVADARKAVMKANLGHLKAIGAVAKGKMEAGKDTVVHAIALQERAIGYELLFAKGSGGDKTRAKDEIWSDWGKFMQAVDAYKAALPGLVVAVKSGDRGQIGGALKAVGKTCGGCHKPYRAPKKK